MLETIGSHWMQPDYSRVGGDGTANGDIAPTIVIGDWSKFAMTTPDEPRLHDWDQDDDELLRNGW